ncbi:hypothetical protein [Helicobacter rodentium]|uniref:hypothetical protein n=1 Tax=Helicobacter rodentium TaxID=59617 RepID=UPI0025B235B9|nr:hypothetical protein [Helicobacter rodentium]
MRDSALAESAFYFYASRASLRESETNEAIYNLMKINLCNGIFKEFHHYRLPQPLMRLRNDEIQSLCHREG